MLHISLPLYGSQYRDLYGGKIPFISIHHQSFISICPPEKPPRAYCSGGGAGRSPRCHRDTIKTL
ncbi:MAG: hypothetical protein RQ885_12035 [Desulfurococcales archaeon]|nr:hypothetical protein [Desulfurococcales archaeon]